MPEVHIDVLGGCSVSVDGRPLAGVPSSFFRMIAYVLLSGHNFSVARQRLAGVMWPDIDHTKANSNLRQVLSRVRHFQGQLGVDFLQSTFSTVFISPSSGLHCDLLELVLALRRADMGSSVAISSLYLGDLLVDLAESGPDFEDWLSDHRNALRDRVVSRLTNAVQDTSGLTPADQATCATRLLTIDPCNEDAFQALMMNAAAHGHIGRVRTLFESCQRRLMHDLGVRPSPETLALYDRLTRQAAQ